MTQNKINNSNIMNKTELRHILSAKFDFNVWKELLDTLFPKVELFNKEVQVDSWSIGLLLLSQSSMVFLP